MSQNVKAGLYSLITTDTTVGPLIGNARMYPVEMVEAPTLPAIKYYRVIGVPVNVTFDSSGGPERHRFEFDCYAEDSDSAEALANALISLLHGYSGTLSEGTFVTIVLAGIRDTFAQGPRQFITPAEFYITFNRNTN